MNNMLETFDKSDRPDGLKGRLKEGKTKILGRLCAAKEDVRLILWNWPVLFLFLLTCKLLLQGILRVGTAGAARVAGTVGAEGTAAILIFLLSFPFLVYIEAAGIIFYLDDGSRGRQIGVFSLWQRGLASLCLRNGARFSEVFLPVVPFLLPLFAADIVFFAPDQTALLFSAAACCVLIGLTCCGELLSLPGVLCSGYSSFWAGKESRRLLRGKGLRTLFQFVVWFFTASLGGMILLFLYWGGISFLETLPEWGMAAAVISWLPRLLLSVYVTVCTAVFPFFLYEKYRGEEIDWLYQQEIEVLQVYREYRRRVEELIQEQWSRVGCRRRGTVLRNFFFKNY